MSNCIDILHLQSRQYLCARHTQFLDQDGIKSERIHPLLQAECSEAVMGLAPVPLFTHIRSKTLVRIKISFHVHGFKVKQNCIMPERKTNQKCTIWPTDVKIFMFFKTIVSFLGKCEVNLHSVKLLFTRHRQGKR